MKFHHLALVALLAGCGKHPGTYTTVEATAADTAATKMLTEADALWEERVDPVKLKASLDRYKDALDANPGNRHALQRLTRGWYFYGDSHTTVKEEQIERWGIAIEYGTQCLAINTAFADAIAAGEKEKDATAHATAEDVPCLYWTASALGKWAKAQSLSKTLKHLPTVKAYISKVEELQPEYWHFGPARYWGAYYSALPSFAGQDFDKSAAYFQTSIDGAPYYLGTLVLRADFLAVPTSDIATFDADLAAVLAADTSGQVEIAPENTLEQVKARALIEKRPELFPRKVLEAADSTNGDEE
jgi:hypothetical protein